MMRSKLLCLLFFIVPLWGFSQNAAEAFKQTCLASQYLSKTELKDKMVKNNFARLYTVTDNWQVYGFIGDDHQRIKVKFISVIKDAAHPDQYSVVGKSMVKTNVCDFKGTLTITNIRKHLKTSYGVDDEYLHKGILGQYTIIGDYLFSEDSTQPHSGIFKGTFQTECYLTKDGKIHYDDIDLNADGYSNNQFVGTWTIYSKKLTQTCNWGDYRIPNSGDLDIGAGDFSPADKYLPFGWQTLRDRSSQNKEISAKAKKEENHSWWK